MNLKPNEAAEKLNVSVKTLQRWDRDGILKAYRTATNRRYYTEDQIYKVLEVNEGAVIPDCDFSYEEVVLKALNLNIGEHIDIHATFVNRVFGISCVYLLGATVLVFGLYGFPSTMEIMSQSEDEFNYITVEDVKRYFKTHQPDEELAWKSK